MSDHEEATSSGYSTPVPELDDHRHQTSSIQRQDRPRRGTFDSLYGSRQVVPSDQRGEQSHPITIVRDFEEAVADDEAAELSPTSQRSRRPTFESTLEARSISPPNSVKAFAEARRRERGPSFSEGKVDRKHDDSELHRAASVASRQSHRSRPHTIADDAASLATNKSAEEDVCFPLQEQRRDGNLYIDFDYLDSFIKAEREVRENQRRPSTLKVFPDLRPQTSTPATPASAPAHMVTADGDFFEVPGTGSLRKEKSDQADEDQHIPTNPQPVDPSRVSFFSSAWESTIHAADLEGLVLPDEDIRGLFAFPKGETDGVWWLNINKPSEEEVRAVCRSFGIHPLTIEDITTQEAREKIELFPSYYFACFKSFFVEYDEETHEKEFVPFTVYTVVFREGTLSFSYAPNLHASHVRRRITMLKDYVALSSDWICYALIDDIVDSAGPVITDLEHHTDQIEDEVFIARTDDMHKFLRKIGNVRKNVMSLMRILGGKADVLKGFTKRCNENYKVTPRMDIGLYLGDIQDHVVTMMTNLGHSEKMLSRAHSNYLAQLQIDGIAQGTRNNKVLSKITVVASVIVPLNVVTGLFGMNVHVPWMDEDNLYAFSGIVALLVLFCIVTMAVARRMRYI